MGVRFVAIVFAIVVAVLAAPVVHDQLTNCQVQRLYGRFDFHAPGIISHTFTFGVCPATPLGAILTSLAPLPRERGRKN